MRILTKMNLIFIEGIKMAEIVTNLIMSAMEDAVRKARYHNNHVKRRGRRKHSADVHRPRRANHMAVARRVRNHIASSVSIWINHNTKGLSSQAIDERPF